MSSMVDNTNISRFDSNNQSRIINKNCRKNLYCIGIVLFSCISFLLFLSGIIMSGFLLSHHTSDNIKYWRNKNSTFLFFPWILLTGSIFLLIGNLVYAIMTEKKSKKKNKSIFIFWHIISHNLFYFLGDVIIPESNGFVIIWYYFSFLLSFVIWRFVWKKYQEKTQKKTTHFKTIQINPISRTVLEISNSIENIDIEIEGTLEEISL